TTDSAKRAGERWGDMRHPVLNALTVDVEDWYHGNDFNIDFSLWDMYEDRVCDSTEKVLEILARYQVKATFFILGHVAGKHPRLVRRIYECGHEIGTHGYRHRPVYTVAPAEYREDLMRSTAAIEDITGQAVKAHRAPFWSITRKSLWALDILEEKGFDYDSSIFPVLTPLFGLRGAPRFPYTPRLERIYAITEFPPSVVEIFGSAVRVPFSGGFFLRSLPCRFVRKAIRSLNAAGHPAMIYVHPWELDTAQPVLRAPAMARFTHYHNLSTTGEKLRMLLREFRFGPAAEVLASTSVTALSIGQIHG
ncbi:MAG: XrtA system polysaccharide deacetylase, partial [Bacillota bacterium]